MIKAHTTHRRQFADKDDDHGEGPDVGGLPIKKRLQLADAARPFFMIWSTAVGSAQLPQVVAFPLDRGPNRGADSDGLLSLAPLF